MKIYLSSVLLGLSASFTLVGVAQAGVLPPAPAPLLGAGLPGLAVLGALGAGYAVVRFVRRKRD